MFGSRWYKRSCVRKKNFALFSLGASRGWCGEGVLCREFPTRRKLTTF